MSTFFIAEIGINHNGDIKICKQLIDLAITAGCDAVKFQKRDIDTVYSKKLVLNSMNETMKRLIIIVKKRILNGLPLLGI